MDGILDHQMATGGETQRRAGRLEILGAWLRVWTPPRETYVPPIPWRKIGLGTLAGIVVLGIALAIMVPRIDHGKAVRAAATAQFENRARAANVARIIREQRPRHGADAALKPAAGATPAEQAAARSQLLAQVEASILADSRAREKTGEMRHVVGPTTCKVTPGTTVRNLGVYDCFAPTGHIKATKGNVSGVIGYPFRAVVDYRSFSYAFCKTEQFPGEMMIPKASQVVKLPPACRIPAHT
jgi:hypothetical protein